MSDNKKKQQLKKRKKHFRTPPWIVFVGCFKIKSFFLLRLRRLFRRKSKCCIPHSPSSSSPLLPLRSLLSDGTTAAEAYSRSIQRIEFELLQLDRWLSAEARLRDFLNDNTNIRSCNGIDHGMQFHDVIRLGDGSYVRGIEKSGRLSMHVSSPSIILLESGPPSVLKILRAMASMGADNLFDHLIESTPLIDLQNHQTEQMRWSPVSIGSENGFTEAIVLDAVHQIEILALQGLNIQMGLKGGRPTEDGLQKLTNAKGIVLAVLIQLRDPREDYVAVGDVMIGLIEAATAEIERGFLIRGVHVAGVERDLSRVIKSNEKETDGVDFLWSLSLRGCERGSPVHVRNPDIGFAS